MQKNTKATNHVGRQVGEGWAEHTRHANRRQPQRECGAMYAVLPAAQAVTRSTLLALLHKQAYIGCTTGLCSPDQTRSTQLALPSQAKQTTLVAPSLHGLHPPLHWLTSAGLMWGAHALARSPTSANPLCRMSASGSCCWEGGKRTSSMHGVWAGCAAAAGSSRGWHTAAPLPCPRRHMHCGAGIDAS